MVKKLGIFGLLVALMLAVGVFAGTQRAQAFPRGSVFRNITVNPGAIPSDGRALVTVSYLCEASGCFDKGGFGQLIVKPGGIFKQVSSCSVGALFGGGFVPGSYACFDGPLSNDAIVNFGNQRLPTNQILIPPPEPATPELHVLQAVVEANGVLPGTTLIICYQEEPVRGFFNYQTVNGSHFAGIDLLEEAASSIVVPPGDPPSAVVSGASGVYASLCVFVLVTSGSPQHITLLDVATTNIGIGGRAVIRALITDQNGNPIPGVPVSFSVSDPSQASLACATNQDFTAAGYAYNPLFPASFPPPAGVPSTGYTPNLGNPFTIATSPGPFLPGGSFGQAGQTTPGSPIPGTGTTNTPLGYTCYSGTALGGATGLGTVPPGTITALTDNTGVAYVTLVGLASAERGAGVVVTATVFEGGIPPREISARSTPFIITGAATAGLTVVVTASPTTITAQSTPPNVTQVQACFTSAAGLAAPSGQSVVFTLVERTAGVVDAAFAQNQSGDQNEQVTRPTGANGCAVASLVATGSGTITVSAAVGTSVGTISVPVGGTGGVQAGQAGFFGSTPTATTGTCPGSNQWLGLYWRGPNNTPIATAAGACPNADRFWVRRGTSWLGFAPDQPGASDQFDLMTGEFAFVHGRP